MLQRIMLVDDSDGEALLIKQTLREAGFEDPIFHVRDPEDALAYLQGDGIYANRKAFPLPEILLLDLGMPRIDGYQLLKWIRAQRHLAPMIVVVLTAESDPKRISLAYQLGATSFLSKHGSLEEYRQFVQFFRSYACITNTIPQMEQPSTPAVPLPTIPFDDKTGADGGIGSQASA